MNRIGIRLLCVGLLLAVSGSAFALNPAHLNRVTFVNRTGYDIDYLFFSPGDSSHWGADILGTTGTLNDEEKIGFYIHYPEYSNTFDFLAIDTDGDAYIMWNVEISDDGPALVEITLDDLESGHELGTRAVVNLVNETGYDIWYVFFSPGDSEMWGIDMLDVQTILEAGETLSLFVPLTDAPVRYDFGGLDEDDDMYQFWVELSSDQLEYTFAIELSDLQ